MENKNQSSSSLNQRRQHEKSPTNSSFDNDLDEKSISIQKSKPNLKGDYMNIAILLFLYLLQGIPLGLISGIPLIMMNRGIDYSDQAIFSFSMWPFSLKLLWAPIVDSVYSSRFGRRKSWMIPSQYLIGAFMIVTSYYLDSMMNSIEGPNIYSVTALFLILNFLAATQDIAVDGWALTMLKPCNVGYASTCNSVGQTAGYFLGYVVFLILESPHFANYFRQEPQDVGLITLDGFFYFWGIVFIIVTTLVLLFKSEQPTIHEEEDSTIRETYLKLIQILKLGPIKSFTIILLTCKIGFSIADAATPLKLKEAGLPMDHIALMAIPLLPLQVALPWIIGRYTNGPRPLDVFLRAYPFRLIFSFLVAGIVWWTRVLYAKYSYFPAYYYVFLIIIYCFHQVIVYSMFVSIMSFHAKISDPSIGGTYMTLLNTLTNLGGNWPNTLALSLLDYINLSYCSLDGSFCFIKSNKTHIHDDSCIEKDAGNCVLWLDGYYTLTFFFALIGTLWYFWSYKLIVRLQSIPKKQWLCPNSLKRRES
uniref:Acetyl-coenzyme A transporter 1-like n=1 Tax=Dermatophagoides pteronyssinus TaxID=6956 RepID=A0A6P6YAP2_DERPT|nr:acetyl-coenzyme A transporter 1-like [Dermatophagoides pteronyssinus]